MCIMVAICHYFQNNQHKVPIVDGKILVRNNSKDLVRTIDFFNIF